MGYLMFNGEKIGYVVSKSGTGSLVASNITYDNTTTDLAATTVQEAIDELSNSVQYITLEDYNNLGEDVNTNGITYCVIDGDMTADTIVYDNSVSGLESINVQDAIDELSASSEWKLFGSVTGLDTILDFTSLSGKYKELEVTVTLPLTTSSTGTFTIPLRKSGFNFSGYCYDSSYNGCICVNNTSMQVCIKSIWTKIHGNNDDDLSSAVLELWYR